MLDTIKKESAAAIKELLEVAKLKKGDLVVIGCSSSEIGGKKIGTLRSQETADAVFGAIYPVLKKKGIFLAVQCCEHLNRALVVAEEYALSHNLEIVNALPQKEAGGAFAQKAYSEIKNAVLVESVKADAGLDIGDTFIGMHLKAVAVPVRLSVQKIGEAHLSVARTRPKFVGGERAIYNENLM